MRKVLYTLNIGGYVPEITALTYPLIDAYARKIGAERVQITTRRYPGWPVVYEKLQIHRLAQENKADWHIYLDSDALVHPDTPDWSNFLPMDTVAHNGIDFANLRWRYCEVFRRDGRHVGSCNWNTWASSWCIDLWRPLEMGPAEAIDRIFPTQGERGSGVIEPSHLVDDFALSYNIARHGLKVQTLIALEKQLGIEGDYFFHAYDVPIQDFPGVRVRVKETGREEAIPAQHFSPLLHEKLEDVTLAGKVTLLKRTLARWRVQV